MLVEIDILVSSVEAEVEIEIGEGIGVEAEAEVLGGVGVETIKGSIVDKGVEVMIGEDDYYLIT